MSDGTAAAATAPTGQQGISSFLSPTPPPGGGAAAEVAVTTTAAANAAAAKLDFPVEVPVATRDAVRSFKAPTGRKVRPIPANTRSGIVFYGVRLDIVTDPDTGAVDPNNHEYACVASANCRNTKATLKLKNNTTTGAMSHLLNVHGIKMNKTNKQDQK